MVRIASWRQHLDDVGLFDVEDLAEERQDRLDIRIAPLLGGRRRRNHPRRGTASVSSFDFDRQSESFAGQAACLPGEFFRRVNSRAFRAASRASAASMPFSKISLASFGFSSRNEPSFSLTDGLNEPFDFHVEQLVLRLAFKRRLGQLHRDDRDQSLAQIIAAGTYVLQNALALGIAKNRVVMPVLKPLRCVPPSWLLMLLAKLRICLVVAVVVLQCHFDDQPLFGIFLGKADHRRECVLALIEKLDVFDQPVGVLVDIAFTRRARLQTRFRRRHSETPVRAGAWPVFRGRNSHPGTDVGSGLNVTLVPVLLVFPMTFRLDVFDAAGVRHAHGPRRRARPRSPSIR